MQQPQGLNLYPYVMNNPLRYTDPDGQDWAFNKTTGALQFLGAGPGDPKKRRKYEGKPDWQILPDGFLLDGTDAWGEFWGKYRGHYIRLHPSGHAERLQETDETARRRWLKEFERDSDARARRWRDLKIGADILAKYLKAGIYALSGMAAAEGIAAATPMLRGSITTLFSETPIPGVIEKAVTWVGQQALKRWPLGFDNEITSIFPEGGPRISPLVPVPERAPTAKRGSVAEANFAQSKIRKDETFSKEGVAKYSELAGSPVTTVDDLVAAIKSGAIKPSQLPVDYVVTADGTKLILNTRTSVTLHRAGVPRSEWYGINRTGEKVPGGDGLTYDDLARQQLKNNKLPPTGTPDIPKGKE